MVFVIVVDFGTDSEVDDIEVVIASDVVLVDSDEDVDGRSDVEEDADIVVLEGSVENGDSETDVDELVSCSFSVSEAFVVFNSVVVETKFKVESDVKEEFIIAVELAPCVYPYLICTCKQNITVVR